MEMVDRLRNHTVAIAIMIALASSGCQVIGPDKSSTVISVASGDSFGECLGYCKTQIEASPTRIVFSTEGGTLAGPLPALSDTVSIEHELWSHLVSLARVVPVHALDSIYGCPDCADGGAEWVEIEFAGDESRRITFEFRHAPGPLASLSDTLRTVRRDHWNELESD